MEYMNEVCLPGQRRYNNIKIKDYRNINATLVKKIKSLLE